MKLNIISWFTYLVITSSVVTCRHSYPDAAIAGTSKHVTINNMVKRSVADDPASIIRTAANHEASLLTFIDQDAREVPILCYHNIYTGNVHEPGIMYISQQQLGIQLKALSDSGYQCISPEQLYACLTGRKPLPPRSFLLTFDDSRKEHRTLAAPLLEKFRYKAIFFVMTVTIGKNGYLSAEDIQYLHNQGNEIGAHTWDHPHLLKTGQVNITQQIAAPKSTLEKITGAPVTTFAYPFGEWNDWIIEQLRLHGYLLAFRLSDNKISGETLYTIRRMMVSGTWSGEHLIAEMKRKF